MASAGKLAILVGGGPAPGINSVIGSATVKAINEGFDVLGIQDGFKHLVKRDPSCARPLSINDVSPLPPHIPTFGFQTARHVGAELVQNLMEDARATRRWYIVVAMGRQAGHLALGIGKASGATLTLIREEFEQQQYVPFAHICDIIEGTIIKRRAMGRQYGVAVLAEGIIEKLDPKELADLQDVEKDDHGHIRFAEVDLARKVKVELEGRFKQRGLKVSISNKNIGYEVRCCDPIPFDMAYCRELGNAAIRFLLNGGSGAMVSVQNGRLVPLLFDDIRDPNTGKTRVRNVDINSETYRVAREYMLRLDYTDFEKADWAEKLARAGNLSVEELKKRFA